MDIRCIITTWEVLQCIIMTNYTLHIHGSGNGRLASVVVMYSIKQAMLVEANLPGTSVAYIYFIANALQ